MINKTNEWLLGNQAHLEDKMTWELNPNWIAIYCGIDINIDKML